MQSPSERLSNFDMTAQQVARNDVALNLIGALKDTPQAHFTVPSFNGKFFGIAHAAVNLQNAVNHMVDHVRAIELGDGCGMAVILVFLGLPGGIEGEPARGL